jgi:hypothetical protein
VSDYELSAYEPAHRADYLRLLHDAWGELALTGDEFDWWFKENPAGSLMSIARVREAIAGVASHSLFRMMLGGEEKLASFSVHATTADSARGKGVFPALESRHEQEAQERGVPVSLACPTKPTPPIFLGPLGWTEIGRIRVWARPFPRRFRKRRPYARIERFRHAGDAARAWPNHVVRDAAYLNWRYLQSPRDYVADLVGNPGFLLRACLAEVRPEARALIAIPAREHRATYASMGFFPTRTRLHFMGKALAGDLDLDLRSWRFTLGDTDFF